MEYIALFIYLYLGHLIGDMLLQTKAMVKTKGKAFDGIILHSVVVTAVTAMTFLCINPRFIMVYIIIFIGHTIIDEIKCKIDEISDNITLLIIDQVVHFIFLLLLVLAIRQEEITSGIVFSKPYFSWLYDNVILRASIIISGFILAVQFGGNLVQKAMTKYVDYRNRESMTRFHKSIGITERVLVFIFAVTDNISSIAFLMIARAIYCMIEMKYFDYKREDAEPVIIKSFISFCWSTIVGVITWVLITH